MKNTLNTKVQRYWRHQSQPEAKGIEERDRGERSDREKNGDSGEREAMGEKAELKVRIKNRSVRAAHGLNFFSHT